MTRWWTPFLLLMGALASAKPAIKKEAHRGGPLYDIYMGNPPNIVNKPGPALDVSRSQFYLNGKELLILSGSTHYFRMHPDQWRDRLRKMKAAGLNTLITYVPWNLHEPLRGQTNYTGSLDLRAYLKMAQEEDLFVIVRPGPYICSEFEYGGLPGWLLREDNIVMRTNSPPYLQAAEQFFRDLFPHFLDLQFTYGGPIIAVQVENEYGNLEYHNNDHLVWLRDLMTSLGVVEQYVTSDTPSKGDDRGAVAGALMTANFQSNATTELTLLQEMQPGQPLMVMEYWSGWYDQWGRPHSTVGADTFEKTLLEILNFGSSVNFYMMFGGTNFGFTNGANANPFLPVPTSYDYDCPISEAGDYTEKYDRLHSVLAQYTLGKKWDVPLPPRPMQSQKTAYGNLTLNETLSFESLLSLAPVLRNQSTKPMERLDVNNGKGQVFGFVLYRREGLDIPTTSSLLFKGQVNDRAQLFLNSQPFGIVTYDESNASVAIPAQLSGPQKTLDILVENRGRVHYGVTEDFSYNRSAKGLREPVHVLSPGSDVTLDEWTTYSLQFDDSFLNKLPTAEWTSVNASSEASTPALYRGSLYIEFDPTDTFLRLPGWTKGVAFINNFNLGRYWRIGPQQTLYVPGPIIHRGENEVLIFEQEKAGASVLFVDTPVLDELPDLIS